MAKLKTTENDASVDAFLEDATDEQKRLDSAKLIEIMKSITRKEPKMWGSSIIGFGSYHYRYASGHEGDAPLVGFSPRKDKFSIYLTCGGFDGQEDLLAKLGKYKMGKACLYVKRLDDVHLPTLKKLIRESVRAARKMDCS